MPENLKAASVGPQQGASLEKSIPKGSTLKKLIRLFRTNSLVKHHFQVAGSQKPQGTARAFFKNAYSYQSSVIPGYSAYDRFARYSDYAEMESYPVLANALNIVADEVTQKNEEGKIIQAVSESKEIAQTLGISEGTSKSQYARAKKLLQEMIIEAETENYERREQQI